MYTIKGILLTQKLSLKWHYFCHTSLLSYICMCVYTSIFSSSSCRNSPMVLALVARLQLLAHITARDRYSIRWSRLSSTLMGDRGRSKAIVHNIIITSVCHMYVRVQVIMYVCKIHTCTHYGKKDVIVFLSHSPYPPLPISYSPLSPSPSSFSHPSRWASWSRMWAAEE